MASREKTRLYPATTSPFTCRGAATTRYSGCIQNNPKVLPTKWMLSISLETAFCVRAIISSALEQRLSPNPICCCARACRKKQATPASSKVIPRCALEPGYWGRSSQMAWTTQVIAEQPADGFAFCNLRTDKIALGRHQRDEIYRNHPEQQEKRDVDGNLCFETPGSHRPRSTGFYLSEIYSIYIIQSNLKPAAASSPEKGCAVGQI